MVHDMAVVAKAWYPLLPDRTMSHSVDCTKALSSVVQGISRQCLGLDVQEESETLHPFVGQVGHIETLSLKIWDLDLATLDSVDTESTGQSHLESEVQLSCGLTRDLMYPGVSYA
jgi:hypothetical protein